jgi:hypothetical protein
VEKNSDIPVTEFAGAGLDGYVHHLMRNTHVTTEKRNTQKSDVLGAGWQLKISKSPLLPIIDISSEFKVL